ncbi:MAG: putative manganese-dependent inorganic diphosphatase [Pedosphaera sp.]|nr:putative manganese-dependent inorganic diphosphatase [Pedosphaera sp.]
MSETLVIGHRNPDTDAICSAIGYAEFKRLTGMKNVVAARCGDCNDRTDFVLKSFGVDPPRFVADVSPQVHDVMVHDVVSVPLRTSLFDALTVMDQKNIRVLPVLDSERRCHGLLSIFKASKFFLPNPNRIFDSRRVLSSIRTLAQTLGGSMLCAFNPDSEEDLVLMVGAMKPSSFNLRLSSFTSEKLVVVVGDREDIQRTAIQGRVRVLIITGGHPASMEILSLAQNHEVTIILSPHDSATTATLCRAAVTVDHLLREDFLTFKSADRLEEAQRLAAPSQFQAFPVIDDDNRVVGMLSKSDFLKQVDRRLILVDHNELNQAVHGADQIEILEVIDHHRIGTFTTQQPILFRNEPVGSTSTIVADCFFRHGIELSPSIAGLLLAGLVSDTLNLTSPTSTQRDVEILGRLEKIAKIEATRFTQQLFSSGSVLTSRPATQAITTDCKEYCERIYRFSVAQIEEVGFEQFDNKKAAVIEALRDYRNENGYEFSALLITDVVLQNSLLLIAGQPRFLRTIPYPEREAGVFNLQGVVSRKKQLLPFLTDCLARMTL